MAAYTGTDHQPPTFNWQDGDIAFLKRYDEFDAVEYLALIKSGYVKEGATGHPVIVLEHSKDSRYFLVTTVSAYKSGTRNGYLPPWEQPCHTRKHRDSFRAFQGSARPNDKQKYLKLADGGRFPKPQTSWVYAPFVSVVPSSALTVFDKTKKRLRMTPESLDDLLQGMRRDKSFAGRWTNPRVRKMLKATAQPKLAPSSNAPVANPVVITIDISEPLATVTPPPSPPQTGARMTWADIARQSR
ncbi:hypothetical protein M426DRAFT_18134 [Hypoxylon sp. CI-4A]|nr:hypothetical protein M426DRAFT_18134 [Hypoxylon sp. CI-4A]